MNVVIGTPGTMLQLDEIAYELRDRMTGFSMGGQRFAFSAALQALARKGGTLPDASTLSRHGRAMSSAPRTEGAASRWPR